MLYINKFKLHYKVQSKIFKSKKLLFIKLLKITIKGGSLNGKFLWKISCKKIIQLI